MVGDPSADQLVKLPRHITELIAASAAPRALYPDLHWGALDAEENFNLPIASADAWTARIAIATMGAVLVTTLAAETLLVLNGKQFVIEFFLGIPPVTLIGYLALRNTR
jgi:hypothetical protein